MKKIEMINRREFLKASSLAFACMFVPGGYQIATAAEALNSGNKYSPFVWFVINKDNSVIIFSNKSEMGQGIHTGIAIVVSDELDCDLNSVKIMPSPVTTDYVDPQFKMHLTGGSTSMRNMYEPLRIAAATAREMLLLAAADRWKISKEKCQSKLGYVINRENGEKIGYGELVEAASKVARPTHPTLKKPNEYAYMGKEVVRLDMEEKSTGRAKFATDYFLDGMLYAAVAKPDKFGAKLLSVDEKALAKVDGFVKIVPLKDGVAFVSKSMNGAFLAKSVADTKFDGGVIPAVDNKKVKAELEALITKKGDIAVDTGEASKVLKKSKQKLQATYHLPYLHHMLMEPQSCIASVKNDSCRIITGTQNQSGSMMVAKAITGLSEDKIEIETTYLGTGLGRKANPDFVADALIVSKTINAPIKLQYDRGDEIFSGMYRPASFHKIEVALNKGKIAAWSHDVACAPIMKRSGFGKKEGYDHASVEGIADTIYSIPSIRVESHDHQTEIPIWFWRSVGNSQNGFVMETMMDELAYDAKMDPIEFRLANLTHNKRAADVLKKVAEMSQWGKKPLMGEAKGCAVHYCFGSFVAEVAEISLDKKSGAIKVHRVDCVIDMGPFTVHRDSVVAQMESAIIMGLSAALYEEVNIKNGGAVHSNFHDYEIAKISDAPEIINVEIINGEGAPGGVGEPGLPPIAPAIANALFGITGLRARTLPLKPQKILDGIKGKKKYI